MPLYSWLEDFDLARQLLVRGEIRKLREAVAVHRVSDSGGRTAHLRFGYSQVANPLWLLEKGTFTKRLVARLMLRPMAMNVILAPIPGKRYAMRRQRLIGTVWRCGTSLGVVVMPPRNGLSISIRVQSPRLDA
ncbi:MAG: hypothetical protein VB093_20435 [Propionicimonas sp.]|nr:hypothetical protein [Propionicimonas sp.]